MKYLVQIFAILALSACGTMIAKVADFDLEGTLTIRNQSSEPVEKIVLSKTLKDPRKISPYADLFCDGQLMSANFSINSDFIRMNFYNKSNGQIKLRFDEAELRSNFQPKGVKLKVYSSVIAGDTRYSDTVTKGVVKNAPALILDSHQKSTISMSPDFSGVFPNKKIFNIRLDENERYYLDNSTSSTLELIVPIEYEGRSEILILNFSPTSINSRKSYR